MKIIILKLARDDLKEIREYLSDFGENPPKKFREGFEKFCDQISGMPYVFNEYELNPVYRKAVIVFDYLVFYRIDEKCSSKGRFRYVRVCLSR